ncbi:MAG: hypothetical protein QXS20_06530 [Candidatus Thorarchaeota archaeon]
MSGRNALTVVGRSTATESAGLPDPEAHTIVEMRNGYSRTMPGTSVR